MCSGRVARFAERYTESRRRNENDHDILRSSTVMRGDNPDLFDTSRVRDDAGYWDALAERIAADAARVSKEGWGGGFEWFAHSRASWVAASLVLAAAAAFLMLPSEASSTRNLNADWALALAPADDVGRALVLRDDPPAIGALLLGRRDEGER